MDDKEIFIQFEVLYNKSNHSFNMNCEVDHKNNFIQYKSHINKKQDEFSSIKEEFCKGVKYFFDTVSYLKEKNYEDLIANLNLQLIAEDISTHSRHSIFSCI